MQCCWNSKEVLQNFDFTFYMSRQICSLVREGSGGHVATSCLTQQLEAHLSFRGDLRGTSLRDRSRRENASWSFSQSGHGELFVCCLFTRLKQGRLWRSKKHSSRYLAFFFWFCFCLLIFFYLQDSFPILPAPPFALPSNPPRSQSALPAHSR